MTNVDPVKLLEQLVRIPSLSGGEEEIAGEAFSWARKQGLSAERAGRNVTIRIGSTGGKRLLLNSHLDTVAPMPSWKIDPFSPVTDNGRIIGLGANDAKGCVAAMLSALAQLGKTEIAGEVVLALTVDEEMGDTGEGLEKLVAELGELDASVIGEPTNLDICRAQKGRLILEVETSGVARHAAHAHRTEGKNAVVEAARAISELTSFDPWPAHHLLGPVTCQVTTIDGGVANNVIPDQCVFTLDIRTVTGIPTKEIIDAVQTKTGATVHVFSDRMKPFETDENTAIVLAARRARPAARVTASNTMSDAVWTRHLPTIKVGPGQTERSHTAGEYITFDELLDGVAFYRRLVTEYFP